MTPPHTAPTATQHARLEVTGLSVTYAGLQAVRDVSLVLHTQQLGCLIGANGAGKSSLLNALAGSVPSQARSVRLDGREVHTLAAHERVRAGLALVPEGRGLFSDLSVAENLRLGAYTRHDADSVADELEHWLTRLPRLRERLHQRAGTLSGGEQQMLAIVRAALSRPRVLLLDEPTMGLAPMMVTTVFELIQEVASQGVSVLVVEQNAHLALTIADYAWVMESGTIAFHGLAAQLRDDARVRHSYLGASPMRPPHGSA